MSITIPTVPLTRDALADRLESEGYVIGKPAHVSKECVALDRETATETTCDQCGQPGLEFLPFRPRDRRQRGYRCLAWCCRCDAAIEL